MGFAIQRADGTYSAWARYQEPRPLLAGEHYVSMEEPPTIAPIGADWDGFRLYCLVEIMGENYTAITTLLAQYPNFVWGIQYRNAKMLRAEIARARADNVANPATGIDAAREAAILDAATTYHIPDVLP